MSIASRRVWAHWACELSKAPFVAARHRPAWWKAMIRLPSSLSNASNGRFGTTTPRSPRLKNFGNGVAATVSRMGSTIRPRAISENASQPWSYTQRWV